MTVTSASLSTGVIRASIDQSTKLSAVLNNFSPATSATKSVDSTAAVALETPLLNDAATLRVQSVSVAFTTSQLDVVDSGAEQVLRILGQLQSLASRAGKTGLSASERTVLNGQFQALKIAINNVPPAPPGSEFTPASLLGNLAGEVPAEDADVVLGGFSDTALLGKDINLLSDVSVEAALGAIATANTKIVAQRDTLNRLKNIAEFATASVDSALQNQEAQTASLDNLQAPSLATVLQQQTNASVAAQTSRLPANILQLLSQ